MTTPLLTHKVRLRTVAAIILDPRDADLLRQNIEISLQYGRAVARVTVERGGKLQRIGLHRLVAQRHVPRPSEAHEFVEALNGNKLDCRPCNLAWRTAEDTTYQRSIAEGAPRGIMVRRKK